MHWRCKTATHACNSCYRRRQERSWHPVYTSIYCLQTGCLDVELATYRTLSEEVKKVSNAANTLIFATFSEIFTALDKIAFSQSNMNTLH